MFSTAAIQMPNVVSINFDNADDSDVPIYGTICSADITPIFHT